MYEVFPVLHTCVHSSNCVNCGGMLPRFKTTFRTLNGRLRTARIGKGMYVRMCLGEWVNVEVAVNERDYVGKSE